MLSAKTMIRITLQNAKTHLTKLLKNVKKGEEVIITDRDEPIAKLVPIIDIASKSKRKIGSARGRIKIADDFGSVPEDFKSYSQI